jgi:hypothetical protein
MEMNMDKSTQDQISQYQAIILSCRGKTNFLSKKPSSSHNGYQIKVTNTISTWYWMSGVESFYLILHPIMKTLVLRITKPGEETELIYKRTKHHLSVNQVKKQI